MLSASEKVKQELNEHLNGDLESVYNSLDTTRRNKILPEDVRKFMNKNRIFDFIQEDAERVISRWDLENQGWLTREQFISSLTPLIMIKVSSPSERAFHCPTFRSRPKSFTKHLSATRSSQCLLSKHDGTLCLQDFSSVKPAVKDNEFNESTEKSLKSHETARISVQKSPGCSVRNGLKSSSRVNRHQQSFHQYSKNRPSTALKGRDSGQKGNFTIDKDSQEHIFHGRSTDKIETTFDSISEKGANSEMVPKTKTMANFLKDYIAKSVEVEVIKRQLSMKVDFQIGQLFRLFDRKNQGVATLLDMEDGFNLLKIQSTKNAVYLFVRRYDTDLDGKLSLKEFHQVLLPVHPVYLQNMMKIQNQKEELSARTLEYFCSLMETLLENEVHCENLRQKLGLNGSYTADELFHSLDGISKKGELEANDVRQYLSLPSMRLFFRFRSFSTIIRFI